MKHSAQTDGGRPIRLHDESDFAALRRAGAVASQTLEHVAPHVRPGVTALELDALCDAFMRGAGAVPATVGYHGYRHATCISINHVVTHGIPSDRPLREGDILNVDVTPRLDGWHGDSSRMFTVGAPGRKAERLIMAAWEAMWAGIAAVRPGVRLGDVGAAIVEVAQRYRYSPVRDYCGHGTGRVFHDAPTVHHVARAGTGPVLEPGMVFTVEPMLNAGRPDVLMLGDGWTVITRDRSLSAQFEHTLGVTENGVEIFTLAAGEVAPIPMAARREC